MILCISGFFQTFPLSGTWHFPSLWNITPGSFSQKEAPVAGGLTEFNPEILINFLFCSDALIIPHLAFCSVLGLVFTISNRLLQKSSHRAQSSCGAFHFTHTQHRATGLSRLRLRRHPRHTYGTGTTLSLFPFGALGNRRRSLAWSGRMQVPIKGILQSGCMYPPSN